VGAVTIVAEALVQALVLVLGAVLAVRLDRRARYRRAVEEAVMRLDAPWQTYVGQVTALEPDYKTWHEAGEAVSKLVTDIEVKAAGFGARRRDLIRGDAQQIRGAVTAAVWRLMEGASGPPSEVAIKRLFKHHQDLKRHVLGEVASPFHGVRDWIEEMNASSD
jgi:hypothetical protein